MQDGSSSSDKRIQSFHAIVIGGGLLFFAFVSVLFLYRDNLAVRIPLADFSILAVDLLASACLAYAARRAALEAPQERFSWLLLVGAQGGRGLGDLIRAVNDAYLQNPRSAGWGDLVYLLSDAVFVPAFIFLTRGSRLEPGKFQRELDLGIGLIASVLVAWVFVIAPRANSGRADFAHLTAPFAYAIIDVLLIFTFVELLFGGRRRMQYSTILLLATGAMAKIGAGLVALKFCPPDATCMSGDFDSSFWLLSGALIGLAGLWNRFEEPLESTVPDDVYRGQSFYTLYLPYLWVAASYIMLIARHDDARPLTNAVLAWGTGAVIALVIIRQILVLRDNRRLILASEQELTKRKRAEQTVLKLNEELEERVKARTAQLAATNEELQTEIVERSRVEEKLHFVSYHDGLTGLYNRAYFEEELARLEKSNRSPTSILVADVDRLKAINDRMGHAAGDQVLRRVANLFKSSFREHDIVARTGGDEFTVLMPDTSAESAKHVLLRLRREILLENEQQREPLLGLSLGIATGEAGSTVASAVKLADAAMYREKERRNARLSAARMPSPSCIAENA